MKKAVVAAIAACAFLVAATAGAALVPGVYDPGKTGCPTSTYAQGWLHLAKNCATATNAAAGADITGQQGQVFTSASFTLKSAAQCQGGSPRFDIVTTAGTFFLGCNNVAPIMNGDGTATYVFTAATIAAAGNQVPVPTGTITAADVLLDVQGAADLTSIALNGVRQVPSARSEDRCKKGKWHDRHFRTQGRCVSHDRHERNDDRDRHHSKKHGHHDDD